MKRAAGLLPDALVILLIVSLPWLEGGASATGLFVGHTIVFLLAAAALLRATLAGRLALAGGWEHVAAGALAVASLASFLGVDSAFGSFLALWDLLMPILLVFTLPLIDDARRRWWARAFAATAAAQAIAALLLPAGANLTRSGTFANANQLAAYLSAGALVSLGLAVDFLRERRRFAAGACAGAALLDLGVVVAVGARGALVAILLVGTIWAAGAARSLPRRARPALVAAIVILASVSALSVAARFERIFDPYRFDRLRIWKAGLEAGADHPVLGLGPGMFERRGYRYAFPLDREIFRWSKRAGSTHSTYIQAWAETGLAGLVPVLALAGLLVPKLWRLARGGPGHATAGAAGAALAVLACLIHGCVDLPFEVPAVTMTLAVLLVPMLRPSRRDEAAWSLDLPLHEARARRRALPALAGAALTGWLGAVLLPYAADRAYAAGVSRSRPGLPDAAVTRSIELNPFNPAYLAGRAQITWRRDRPLDPAAYAAAHLDLEEARRLDPGRPELILQLAQLEARACFELSADAAALARADGRYREALALGLKDPRPRLELALFILSRGGPAQEAIGLMREALALEPRYLGARLALANALLESGQPREGARELSDLRGLMRELASYAPRNDYEADLMRVDGRVLELLEKRLG